MPSEYTETSAPRAAGARELCVAAPLAVRTSENLRRVIRAIEESTRVVSESMRLRDRRQRQRTPTVPHPDVFPVWSSPERGLACRLIARTASIHEVELTMKGAVIAVRVFNDPVEAADEASRLRRLLLETDESI